MTPARVLLLCAAVLGAGCGFKAEKIFASYSDIEVQEVARSLQCGTANSQPRVQLFAGPGSARAWAATRTVALPEVLAETPHVVVELGQRASGGYGLAISRSAVLRGGLLILRGTFISPAPGRVVTQALTSPCVLVQLPPGRYSAIEVQDPAGAVRISGPTAEVPAEKPATE